MHYELFSIGPVTFYSYGLMIGLGFLGAIGMASKRAAKYGLDSEHIWNLWYVCIIFGLLGAKLLYVITEFDKIIQRRLSFSDIAMGFVVYGGIIGGLLGIIFYCRWKKLSAWKYLDLIVPSVALGQAFGRIGCFMAGCCYGRVTTSAIGVNFHNSPFAPNDVAVLPTQVFSSIGDFAIMAVLLFAARKNLKDGLVTSFYFLLYGVGRFLIEFLRNDPRGSIGALSTSQFISIFIVIFGAVLFVWSVKKEDPVEKAAQ